MIGRDAAVRRRQRGAVLAEVALTLPLFMVMIFGVIEYGMVYRDHLTLATTTRDAARTGTVLGDDLNADFQILQRIRTSSGAMPRDQITKIIVFKATSPTDTVSAACLAGPQTGECNHYTAAHLSTAVTSASFGCAAGEPDRHWCPSTRNVSQSGPPDLLGVHIEVRRQFLTGMFGSHHDMDDSFILRIEPTDV